MIGWIAVVALVIFGSLMALAESALTRIGFGSKAVINGDSTQTDLASGQTSGLSVIQEILDDIDGIAFCHLGGRDVVRHKIVQDIVEAYDRFGQQRLEVQP